MVVIKTITFSEFRGPVLRHSFSNAGPKRVRVASRSGFPVFVQYKRSSRIPEQLFLSTHILPSFNPCELRLRLRDSS